MTTNEDRAQRIVGGVIDRLTTDKSGVPVATRITQALADAGLLMPDLPEPELVDALIAEKQAHQETLHLVRELWSDVHHHGNVGRASILRHLARILEATDE